MSGITWTRHKRPSGASWYSAPGFQIDGDGTGGWLLMCGGEDPREYRTLAAAKRGAERWRQDRDRAEGKA